MPTASANVAASATTPAISNGSQAIWLAQPALFFERREIAGRHLHGHHRGVRTAFGLRFRIHASRAAGRRHLRRLLFVAAGGHEPAKTKALLLGLLVLGLFLLRVFLLVSRL